MHALQPVAMTSGKLPTIFENAILWMDSDSRETLRALVRTIPVGKDLSLLWCQLAPWLLLDKQHGALKYWNKFGAPEEGLCISLIASLYQNEINEPEQWQKAASAAQWKGMEREDFRTGRANYANSLGRCVDAAWIMEPNGFEQAAIKTAHCAALVYGAQNLSLVGLLIYDCLHNWARAQAEERASVTKWKEAARIAARKEAASALTDKLAELLQNEQTSKLAA